MKKRWAACLVLALGTGLLAGCAADEESVSYQPAIDANGTWNVQADGVALGTMELVVDANGNLSGTLTTVQGAVAQLDGAMDEYYAEFYVTFSAENYFASLTFTADALAASGALLDENGFSQTLRLDRADSSS